MDGKTTRIGSDRALVLDIIRIAQNVPSFPVERWVELQDLSEARNAASTRISWVTLFTKAYALASVDVPELRRLYRSFPWPSYYQSPYSIIALAISRTVGERERLFWGQLRYAESKTLVELQQELDDFVGGNVQQKFRQQLLLSRLPRWIRRLGWWYRNNFQLEKRARRTGTGSLSTLAAQGVYNRLHPCVLTSSLNYGPLENGRMWVTLQCDHRVIDGVSAAKGINRIAQVLNDAILREMKSLSRDVRVA